MDTKQINVKLPIQLYSSAELFAKSYGFRNIQELISESLREKIFEKDKYDNSFSDKEIEFIDSLIEKSLKEKSAKSNLVSEETLRKSLKA